ncbi:MAG: helix-turn-helix domain-containing protein [Bacteroidota bacterium]
MSDLGTSLNVICMESDAFYLMVEQVVERLQDKFQVKEDEWISDNEAMRILRINSKTTLQKYRDEGKIRYSQFGRKSILYDRASLMAFIETNAKDTF